MEQAARYVWAMRRVRLTQKDYWTGLREMGRCQRTDDLLLQMRNAEHVAREIRAGLELGEGWPSDARAFVDRCDRMIVHQQDWMDARAAGHGGHVEMIRSKQAEQLVDRDLARFEAQASQGSLFEDDEVYIVCPGCGERKTPAWIGVCRQCHFAGARPARI